jgi:hypothetical protein
VTGDFRDNEERNRFELDVEGIILTHLPSLELFGARYNFRLESVMCFKMDIAKAAHGIYAQTS